ncbi:MAG: DMT family transporter [Bacteroidota bacterium]|nr:DMT family transporter [Bacteroidota bacterium]
MGNKLINWILFVALCFIWGSSFILMKWGMYESNQQPVLSPYNVAALRMLSSGVIMLPFLFHALKQIPKKILWYVLLSGWLGSFIPAFLFCIAETKVDGALAGSLNSLTPLFVIITGILFFKIRSSQQQVIGVLVGLMGCVILAYANYSKPFGYIAYSGFIIIATFLYGINVNMVHKKLVSVTSIHIATVAFTGLIPPALIVLFFTGYFHLPLTEHKYILSTLSSCVLGIMGTAVASVLFYVFVKRAGGLLASLVTYGVPFIAILWGIYYGEIITYMHIIALLVILAGVYIAYMQKKS